MSGRMAPKGDGVNANEFKPPLLIALQRRFTLGKMRWFWLPLLVLIVAWDGFTLLRHPGIILYPLVVFGIWLLGLFVLCYPIYRFVAPMRGYALCLHWLFFAIFAAMVGTPRLFEDTVELVINPVLTVLLMGVRALWLIGAFVLLRLWLDEVAERADRRRKLLTHT